MSNAISLAKELQSVRSTDVIRDERVRNQFIDVYNSIWKEGGEQVYEREAIYFNQQLRDKSNLRECSALSVFYAFIDLAVKGLTLVPGAQALCYLIPRSVKVGVDANGRDIWEKCCNLTISGYGELVLRKNAGQILHADNPVIVYEGDRFEYGEQGGRKFVNFASSFPRTSNRIIACFLKITRADGSVDYSVMTEQDWVRLQGYSAKNNTYKDRNTGQMIQKPNELYDVNGQIDTGFLMAKCIKHAFKSYPKLKIGRGSSLESEDAAAWRDAFETANKDFDPYAGISGDIGKESRPLDTNPPKQEESFAPAPDMATGVRIDPAAQGSDDDTF